ncbi:MAG: OmpA family protein [Nitrospirae bacterium]|nr:OmpA family protein [Nitrospirota bacterium]
MASSEDNQLAGSFTDLMTSLAVIFILLLCVSHNAAQQEGENTRDNILYELKKELKEFAGRGVKVQPDPNDPLGLLILVPEGLLEFKIDSAVIPPKGVDFLQPFIPKLAKIVCDKRFKDEINSIVVEGHTDSTGSDQHNWELSQKRSMSVVDETLRILDQTKNDKNMRGDFVRFISASGRGSAELIKDNGIENYGQSRRVVFKIRVRSLEQRSYKKEGDFLKEIPSKKS